MGNWFKPILGGPQPSGPVETVRSFRTTDPTLSRDCIAAELDGWVVDSKETQTIRLFEVAEPHVDGCLLAYRARLKTEGLAGRAYLEMWCRLPGRGEFFSKGTHQAVTGTSDWGSYEIPFRLKKGQSPDLVKLNLVIEGVGRVWISDVELLKSPLT